VLKLSAKIRRTDDPNHGRPKYAPGHVFIKTKDGKLYEERQHIHPGHVENPVTADEVQEKYRYNALRTVSREKAEALLRQVMAIERVANLRELTNQLRF
jgi:2-methylcitrate dehydratase PrpD